MSQTKNSIFQENVFVGSECEKIMKELDLNPKSELMNWFYDKVLSFYMTVSKYLQKYFRKGLLSTSLKYSPWTVNEEELWDSAHVILPLHQYVKGCREDST